MKGAPLALAFLLSGVFAHAEPLRTPVNTAIVPAGKLEQDFYDWQTRHEAVMATKDKLQPEIVFLGDSITHLWGGEPNETRGNRGAGSMKALCGARPVLNLGFGWDRTQNVLKRIELGELDGIKPKAVVIHIGTNNLAGTKNARENTPAEIAEAIGVIVDRVRGKCPDAKIILMAVFPRGEKPDNAMRAKIAEINHGNREARGEAEPGAAGHHLEADERRRHDLEGGDAGFSASCREGLRHLGGGAQTVAAVKGNGPALPTLGEIEAAAALIRPLVIGDTVLLVAAAQ